MEVLETRYIMPGGYTRSARGEIGNHYFFPTEDQARRVCWLIEQHRSGVIASGGVLTVLDRC